MSEQPLDGNSASSGRERLRADGGWRDSDENESETDSPRDDREMSPDRDRQDQGQRRGQDQPRQDNQPPRDQNRRQGQDQPRQGNHPPREQVSIPGRTSHDRATNHRADSSHKGPPGETTTGSVVDR